MDRLKGDLFMADIKQQFSLDFLVSKANLKEDVGSQALDEAVIVYSEPIFRILSTADRKEMRMHDLVRAVDEEKNIPSYETFVGVISDLERLKFVEITERDITGNHLVRLLRKP